MHESDNIIRLDGTVTLYIQSMISGKDKELDTFTKFDSFMLPLLVK